MNHQSILNSQGMVVESRERIGGRVWDDKILGCCVGRGAQILTGCINNPLSVLCEQVLSKKLHCDYFAV